MKSNKVKVKTVLFCLIIQMLILGDWCVRSINYKQHPIIDNYALFADKVATEAIIQLESPYYLDSYLYEDILFFNVYMPKYQVEQKIDYEEMCKQIYALYKEDELYADPEVGGISISFWDTEETSDENGSVSEGLFHMEILDDYYYYD